jgi:hypothetical protein
MQTSGGGQYDRTSYLVGCHRARSLHWHVALGVIPSCYAYLTWKAAQPGCGLPPAAKMMYQPPSFHETSSR